MQVKPRLVIGPTSGYLTVADLPDPKTKRWVPRRKAEVVCAVRGGLLSMADAMKRYNITTDEYAEWETHYDAEGLEGLRVTRLQSYDNLRSK